MSQPVKKEHITKSVKETQDIAKQLAQKILPQKSAVVIGLTGELGGGKTAFIQGLARGLGVKEKILSPTFVIFKKFAISQAYSKCHKPGLCKKYLYHFDCYRIEDSKEILELGFKKIISNPQNIIAIEWAGKIRKIMPANTIWLNFNFIDDKTRQIVIESNI